MVNSKNGISSQKGISLKNMEETPLVNKLTILKNPKKKSARELLRAINKPGYEVTIENRGEVIVRIDKHNVEMSLNGKREGS